MERRRGHLQFHTFSRRFVYRWHLTMQGMKTWPKLSNYRRRSQKWYMYSLTCGQDGHVYKTNIRTFIHSFYTLPWWCVFLKHKIQCWPIFFCTDWMAIRTEYTDSTLDQQWLPNQSDFPPISWPLYRAWPSPIMSGFHGAFATGVGCQQGTLTLPDTWFRPPSWDLLVLQLLRPDSMNLPCLYSTFHLEYPLVLSRFCLVSRNLTLR